MNQRAAASSDNGHTCTYGPRRLDGKVAIITGGASGIGASTAKLFLSHGAIVVIADIQDHIGQSMSDKFGDNMVYIHCDVSNEDDIINLVNTTITKYGKLDIMYNNAGIIDSRSRSILDAAKSDLESVVKVNLVGAFLGAKHAARVMVPQQKGCILFTASACACIAGMSTHAYAASKHAIVGLAKNLAAELGGYGIRVNCISPYAVMTNISRDMTDQSSTPKVVALLSEAGNLKGVVLKVEDIANAALYLASDDACYVSGLNLVVDGGFSVVNPSLAMTFGSKTSILDNPSI